MGKPRVKLWWCLPGLYGDPSTPDLTDHLKGFQDAEVFRRWLLSRIQRYRDTMVRDCSIPIRSFREVAKTIEQLNDAVELMLEWLNPDALPDEAIQIIRAEEEWQGQNWTELTNQAYAALSRIQMICSGAAIEAKKLNPRKRGSKGKPAHGQLIHDVLEQLRDRGVKGEEARERTQALLRAFDINAPEVEAIKKAAIRAGKKLRAAKANSGA